MKLGVLVCLHRMVLGGDIINAIDLAARLRQRGHRASVLSLVEPAGRRRQQHDSWALSHRPALELARARGVPVITSERPRGARVAADSLRLTKLIRQHGIDVVHAYGDAAVTRWMLVSAGLVGVPLVVTDYSMLVSTSQPRRVPLIVGTPQLRDEAGAGRPGRTLLLEPPVDVLQDAPGTADGAAFRRAHGVADDDVLLVIVSRFDWYMKLPGILGAIEAVGILDHPSVRLLLVGGGESEVELRERAAAANRAAGRQLVTVADPLVDPRPAYAAADIVLGMGHSALRGMSFGKPVVVLGLGTFCLPVAPQNRGIFRREGFYGDSRDGRLGAKLADQLRPLVADPAERERRGTFARRLVVENYSMSSAVTALEAIYADAVRERSWRSFCLDVGDVVTRRLIRGARGLLPAGQG